MSLRYLTAAILLIASGAACADSLDMNISNKTAQAQYAVPYGLNLQGKSELHAGFLYNDVYSVIGNAGLRVMSEPTNGISFVAGVEALVARLRDNPLTRSYVTAIALNGQIRYSPPGMDQLGIVGELHYAPSLITFGDATAYNQYGVRVEFGTPQVLAYVGYRHINFTIKNGPDAVPDNGMHIGVRLGF